MRAVDASTLRDPQTDEERVKDAEWLVILGKIYPPKNSHVPTYLPIWAMIISPGSGLLIEEVVDIRYLRYVIGRYRQHYVKHRSYCTVRYLLVQIGIFCLNTGTYCLVKLPYVHVFEIL